MIKVGLIEDEPEIRKLLRKIIERQDGFLVVSESDSFTTAIKDFTQFRPDVIFADIDLNGESGLECAKILTEINPKLKVIFATAHSEYMANAFELYAFDYLVKPFPIDRVQTTLSRIKAVITMERASKVEPTEDTLPLPVELSGEKLMVKGKDQIIFLDKEDILFVERQDNTTCITTKEEVLRCSSPLNVLEEKLTPPEFMRCHKSYLINLSHIKRIEPYGRWTYIVKMKGTEQTALMTAKCYEILKNMYQ